MLSLWILVVAHEDDLALGVAEHDCRYHLGDAGRPPARAGRRARPVARGRGGCTPRVVGVRAGPPRHPGAKAGPRHRQPLVQSSGQITIRRRNGVSDKQMD